VGDKVGYKRLQMMTALMFSLPGVPVIYYGDEIGMPGAGDPDSRRMMRFSKWTKEEKATKALTEKITALRRNRLSLIYGDTEMLYVSPTAFVIARDYFGELTVAVFNKSRQAQNIQFELPPRFAQKTLKANFLGKVNQTGTQVSVALPAVGFDFLID
jgi:glycosidase